MRVLNSSDSERLFIGDRVILESDYQNGSNVITAGTVGKIVDINIDSFPDFGLFDIRIITIKFGKVVIGAGEDLIKQYVRKL